MITFNVAYIDENGKHIPRIQHYRNRKEGLRIREVSMDSSGGISHRPISKLACFANPIENIRGAHDAPRTYKDQPDKPRGCALCPSRTTCSTFTQLRIELAADVAAKHAAWIEATKHLASPARYEHASFTAFATACNEQGWTSGNDDALTWQRAENAKRTRKLRAATQQKAKRVKTATPSALAGFDQERGERHDALLAAARAPRARTWLRNLPDRTIALTCDVWQVRAAIESKHSGVISGGDVARAMVTLGRDHGFAEGSLKARVNEAIGRIARLETGDGDRSVWTRFTPDQDDNPPRSVGGFSNGVVSMILEEC